jgi:hypothetical protein
LAHILRVRGVSGQPARSTVQRWHIRHNHLGKRFGVSPACFGQQPCTPLCRRFRIISEGCGVHLANEVAVQAPSHLELYLYENKARTVKRRKKSLVCHRPVLGRHVAKAVRQEREFFSQPAILTSGPIGLTPLISTRRLSKISRTNRPRALGL